jgi:hypothetical protein
MLKLSHMNPITPFYFASQQGAARYLLELSLVLNRSFATIYG